MRFVKMHGIGNDYVYVDAVNAPALAERKDLPALSRRISDRHTGVGSDGLILLCRPTVAGADVRMRMFNADGSESEMCGNGVRCVAKFAHDRLALRAKPMNVETGRGVLPIDYAAREGKLVEATVDMGEPILDLSRIPVEEQLLSHREGPHRYCVILEGKKILGLGIGKGWFATFVSMGNPHAVVFGAGARDFTSEELSELDLARLGPLFESNEAFPRRINTHFVAPRSRTEATMRTWERGAGATKACGTGACAVCVAGVLNEKLDRNVLLHLPGGDLRIRWDDKTNRVFMTGPAEDVFEGDWPD
ncbi:MAG: diaminopimelate epimerase [Phycisphaerales bacterium]